MNTIIKQTGKRRVTRGPLPETEARYKAALDMYRSTTLSVKAICQQTHTSHCAFRSFLHRCHRELMFARHGVNITPQEAVKARLRTPNSQSAAAYAKYKDAISACEDRAYLPYNVSEIARMFHLNPSSLGNQLRVHYPDILKRRERDRHRLGLNDNMHRGVKPWCKEQYAEAVEHLCITDDTIEQTAERYGLSYSGLREHLRYYYKNLVHYRADKRRMAKSSKRRGALTGNGVRHEPSARQVEKYGEAVSLYRTTAMTQSEIAKVTGVSEQGLRNHLRMWHMELILEHRGITCDDPENVKLSGTKRYLKSTAAKYAGAIARLKETGRPTAEVAKEFNLNPETFRSYLHEHEPELAARLGRTRRADGKVVLARSSEKYGEAVRLYATTAEPLKSIAARLNLTYNSLSGFIRRNHRDAIDAHKRLLTEEK